MPLDNFGLVYSTNTGRKLYRSAQPDLRGLIDLYKMNVPVVFKLNDGDGDRTFAGVVTKTPLAGWSLWYDTNKVIDICKQINEELQNVNVLVHCTHGRDRTGLICAAYRLLYDNADYESVMADREYFGVEGIIALVDKPENAVLHNILAMRKP